MSFDSATRHNEVYSGSATVQQHVDGMQHNSSARDSVCGGENILYRHNIVWSTEGGVSRDAGVCICTYQGRNQGEGPLKTCSLQVNLRESGREILILICFGHTAQQVHEAVVTDLI